MNKRQDSEESLVEMYTQYGCFCTDKLCLANVTILKLMSVSLSHRMNNYTCNVLGSHLHRKCVCICWNIRRTK